MNITSLMKNIYVTLTTDETILRLLYYVPVNQLDNPLDSNKENILDKPPKEKSEIINNVIYFMDKKFELDPKKSFSRINFYLGERKPERKYSSGARMLISNPQVSRQELIFDIYTNMEIHQIDMRLMSIWERVNKLLFQKNVNTLTKLNFDYGYSINKTPDGFVGYRLIYYVVDSQSSGCD